MRKKKQTKLLPILILGGMLAVTGGYYYTTHLSSPTPLPVEKTPITESKANDPEDGFHSLRDRMKKLSNTADFYQIMGRKDEAYNIYSKIGATFMARNYGHMAVHYYEKALSAAKALNAENKTANALHNLGQAYVLLGKLPLAERAFIEASVIRLRSKDVTGLSDTYHALSSTYQLGQKYEEAEEVELLSLRLNIQSDNKLKLIDNYISFGLMYNKMDKKKEDACKSFSEAFKLVKSDAVKYTDDHSAVLQYITDQMQQTGCEASSVGFGIE